MIAKMTRVGVLGMLAVGVVACSAAAPEGPEPGEPTTESESEAKIFCGGIAAFPCPSGYVCVDDPTDSCNPKQGGADCSGVCRRGKPDKCGYGDPSKSWVSKDPQQCMLIKFACEPGQEYFFSEGCGCGCQTTAGEACGANVCGAGEYCCNASCGICAPEGGFCTQQFCGPV